MNYSLTKTDQPQASMSWLQAAKQFWPYLRHENVNLALSMIAIIVNSALNLVGPFFIGRAIDLYIGPKDYAGILKISAVLIGVYIAAFIVNYLQVKIMGSVGQRLLFTLRNAIFEKLQTLPVAFFNQNKVGDLISRINNDTEKLNQFFSQSIMQFVGNFFMIIGSGVFMVIIQPRLGLAALIPAAGLVLFTQLLSAWVKRQNAESLKAVGEMSAEIQESLDNFKVIVAFNRRDYFSQKFQEVNESNFSSAVKAGVANNIFTPVYGLASHLAQLIVLGYGIHLVVTGQFTLGLLISFFTYLSRFYDPIRQLASIWATFQVALASWDRIAEILHLKTNITILAKGAKGSAKSSVLSFKDVSFGYGDDRVVLQDANFDLEPAKTYALVGPTGGGKTTTASLMARLYDPTSGHVLLHGRDIRTFSDEERTQKIGFILQEPYLFSGNLKENIVYGNAELEKLSDEEVGEILKENHLSNLLERFSEGLATEISHGGESMSLGQRQLIAFIRAVLREPDVLILDEATANVDTVTEQLLDEVLTKLPAKTTKVVIAHRLNTIENADEIFFVNGSEIIRAGSLKHAVELLMEGKKES